MKNDVTATHHVISEKYITGKGRTGTTTESRQPNVISPIKLYLCKGRLILSTTKYFFLEIGWKMTSQLHKICDVIILIHKINYDVISKSTHQKNKNDIQVKPESFAANSKKYFGNRIKNVDRVAIYVPNFSKFPLKIWLHHTLTTAHSEPLGLF